MIFFDTETCGFHGPTVLIQYAVDDGPIIMHNVWHSPIWQTMDILRLFTESVVCGFNLEFDWFHVCQTYTVLELLAARVGDTAYPIDHIDLYAELEPDARDGPCLKPTGALDLMAHARKGPYQSTMNRDDVRIKRIPRVMASLLQAELDERIPLKDVYFARSKNPKRRWVVREILDDEGHEDPDFVDLVLSFQPSSALKALAQDALGITDDAILRFSDVDLPDSARPDEYGYAPFAKAAGPGAWPSRITTHAAHWEYNKTARKYAEKDVEYTRGLYKFFDCPEHSDDDSILACMVGAVRWRGFRVDLDKIKALRLKAKAQMDLSKYNFNSPKVVKAYLTEVMSEVEIVSIQDQSGKVTTDGITLETIAKWKAADVCDECYGMGCPKCDEGLVYSDEPHPAAIRAQEVLDYRHAGRRIDIYNKLILAGRFHANFNVIGTKSTRMSGSGGLNAQGIPSEKEVRRAFLLAWPGEDLSGGDFDAFEVGLADAAYGDPVLRSELQSGKKIHALLGSFLFDKTYEEILATDGMPGEKDFYKRSKNGTFAILYGGEGYTLKTRVGIPEERGDEAFQRWCQKYKVWGEERKKIINAFCSMRQPGGIGTKVEWHDPQDYIESMLGFRRYFTLENQIVKALFDLANNLPENFRKVKLKVKRRDRIQEASGAVCSALYAAAFALQAANMRAAANHVIQATGGQLTKKLQRKMWDLQPSGVTNWVIQCMNIHDEIMAANRIKDDLVKVVDAFVEEHRKQVPLLGITWHPQIPNWGDKKG